MNYCGKYPCGQTAGGCLDPHCPNRVLGPLGPQPMQPMTPGLAPLFAPVGCVCPPTSEQTCENPACPRQNPLKPRAPKETSDNQ